VAAQKIAIWVQGTNGERKRYSIGNYYNDENGLKRNVDARQRQRSAQESQRFFSLQDDVHEMRKASKAK